MTLNSRALLGLDLLISQILQERAGRISYGFVTSRTLAVNSKPSSRPRSTSLSRKHTASRAQHTSLNKDEGVYSDTHTHTHTHTETTTCARAGRPIPGQEMIKPYFRLKVLPV